MRPTQIPTQQMAAMGSMGKQLLPTTMKNPANSQQYARIRGMGDGRYWTRTSDLHDVNVAL